VVRIVRWYECWLSRMGEDVMRKKKSAILEAVYDTAKGLYRAGAIDQKTLCEFDRLCRSPGELGVGDLDR
jgi:hypothetical protein